MKSVLIITVVFCFLQASVSDILGQTAREFARMGSGKMELEDYEAAISDFSNAVRLQPDYEILYKSYFGRGFSKFQLGEYEEAKDDFDRAIRTYSNDAEVYFWRAYTKYKLRYAPSSEIADYNRAILLDSNYAEAYFNRGHARINNRQIRSGCRDLRKAYELGYEEAEPHIRIYCGEP